MIDLQQGARPDERFHLQPEPHRETWGVDWLFRRVHWDFIAGQYFNTYILFWFIRWYRGEAKVDGSRTFGYWMGQYGTPVDPFLYVVTTTDKEMFAVRIHWTCPDRERVLNMGGI